MLQIKSKTWNFLTRKVTMISSRRNLYHGVTSWTNLKHSCKSYLRHTYTKKPKSQTHNIRILMNARYNTWILVLRIAASCWWLTVPPPDPGRWLSLRHCWLSSYWKRAHVNLPLTTSTATNTTANDTTKTHTTTRCVDYYRKKSNSWWYSRTGIGRQLLWHHNITKLKAILLVTKNAPDYGL